MFVPRFGIVKNVALRNIVITTRIGKTFHSSTMSEYPYISEPQTPELPSYHSKIQGIANKFREAGWTACDAADALVKHGDESGGYLPGLIQQSFNSKTPVTVGPAYTVEYAPLDDPRPAVKAGYIDDAPKGAVIVITTSPSVQLTAAPFTRISNALYGGLMSTRANYLKCAGTVVFGKIRDKKEHVDLDYPVHSYGLGTTAPGSAVKVVAVGEPVEIQVAGQAGKDDKAETRRIAAGDLVIADENGVVVIPEADAQKVSLYIPARVKADTLVASDIKEGVRAQEAQKERRRLMYTPLNDEDE
ncbi:YALI0F22209p [Yarrowia lipolytica CLIB122]|uniref:YALI0F22209p n=3 Tax=Yarrowia lipolytica TaxID=4952 RepID=Q6C0S1_YARLI|nr:YALI0F22209p [Yarrowia lipolytica CLIB122]KAJ8055376.1 ribonuclease E inhibitor RraA/Dimethylmenaquinone methyltransferase [Yarrowia lipolytica]QNP99362.1 4-hydroxy-4-methyl-2-oxoglutarate aldolase [Yarrowia lipolytica]CAG78552.1 YALI0F22209p [Yarrowia lipolytica CLIB122]SEI33083.1 YALIA101S03e09912g1_1 [Yarrowia lipolytica]VBB82580.1 Conserved hypothetical protein [Yarrowia lipolytica]|eukprot:XP_505741.1 YALI0F22209p [Yarrowia lipolytica CLIB122]